MKVAVVPAQITTVEDKIAGNLGLTQVLLLATPVFLSTALYIILPPNLGAPLYKVVLICILFLVFSLLAIRIKGKILLHWTIILLRYNLRPRHYIFNKNDPHLRDIKPKAESEKETSDASAETKPTLAPLPIFNTAEMVKLQSIVNNPKAKLRFATNKKGALNVHISEVKQ